MTIGNKVVPTSTSAQARVMIYQATQRPSMREANWMKTSFGRCSIQGRLGQRHADVVEAILYCAERRRDVSDGGVELLVELHIPADHEHHFRFNVNTISGPM